MSPIIIQGFSRFNCRFVELIRRKKFVLLHFAHISYEIIGYYHNSVSFDTRQVFMDIHRIFRYNHRKLGGNAGRMNQIMDEQNKQPETRTDFRKTNDANRVVLFRVLAIGVVLYWLFGIVKAYVQGGPEAPSLALLIVAIVVMGGGAALVGWLTWKNWKKAKAEAVMTEEEISEMEALRSEDGEE